MRKRYWSEEAALAGLRDFIASTQGKLPPNDEEYRTTRAGNDDWPGANVVLRYWGSMARGFLAAGAPLRRVSLLNVDWTPEEDNTLLELSGTVPMHRVAARLGRTPGACRTRLKQIHGLRAREAQGYLSASEVAREYGAPVSRVKRLVREGTLPATFCSFDTRWQIDPEDAERLRPILTAPKKTHKGYPPDVGDYRVRYGLSRRPA
jgi:hypothetical protein